METLPTTTHPMYQLIAQAITTNASVETIERLLVVQEKLDAKYAKEQFDTAMSLFQSQCPIIKKTKAMYMKSGEIGYKYAPIESIVSQVKSLLHEHGLSYTIQTETFETQVKVTCIAKHSAGHSESSSMRVPIAGKTDLMSASQVVAACITFARRYAFCNAFGILTGDEDTDARQLCISEEAIKEIHYLLEQTGFSEEQLLKAANVSTLYQLKADFAERVIINLRKRVKNDSQSS